MATDRPNIIFILCDDLGPGDLGILWQNQRQTKQKFATPQLDTFAEEGMILTRHYCPAPVCAPSRGSLLTGRHQGHCAVRDQQFDKELPDESEIKKGSTRLPYIIYVNLNLSQLHGISKYLFSLDSLKEIFFYLLVLPGNALY